MAEDETYVCNQLYSIPLAELEPDPETSRGSTSIRRPWKSLPPPLPGTTS